MKPNNHSSLRERTEVPSDMRKLGKDIKVKILPNEEAKTLKSGSVTNRKVTKGSLANSRSWERDVPYPLDGNQSSSRNYSSPLPPTRSSSNSLPNVAPKPQVPQTLSKRNEARYQRSVLKQECSQEVEDRLGKNVALHRKVSLEEGESVGLDLLSKEFKRGKKCSGEVDLSDYPFSGTVYSSSLVKKLPATEKLVSHQEARDLKSKADNMSLSMNKDTLHSGTVNSSPQASTVNKLKYIVHRSPLNGPALEATWRGNFEIPNLPFNTNVISYEGIIAHPSAKVYRIAYEFSKQLPATLHFTFHPQSDFLPETFQIHSPVRSDIALYFYPDKTDKSNNGNYVCLLKFLKRKDMMMKSCIGDVNLLVFPSTILRTDSQRKLDGSYFMWGVFCVDNDKSASGDAASLPPCSF